MKKTILTSVLVIFLLNFPAYSQKTGIFAGIVFDQSRNKPVSGVNIRVDPPGLEMNTDKEGKFQFNNLPLTNYLVRVMKYGYNMAVLEIDLKQEIIAQRTINLLPSLEIYLDEVIVRSKKKKIEGTKKVIHSGQINKSSTSLFNDTMNTLSKLPGAAGREFSGLLYIQGGTPFENVALMDDVVILFPYHWGGRVSIFNPDMVDKVAFYTGGFPVQYGNATSGVIDVSIKKGNFQKFQGYVDLSVTGITLETEAPIDLFRQSSFILGARRTHYDLILNTFMAGEGTMYPYFDDVHLKFYSRLNNEHSLAYNIFYSSDGMRWEFSKEEAQESDNIEAGDYFEYKNQDLINSLQWTYFINERLSMKNTLAYHFTRGFNEFTGSESPGKSEQDQHIIQYRNDWDFSMSQYNSFTFGYLGFFYTGDINMEGYAKETRITGEVVTNYHDFQYNGSIQYHGFYIQDELDIIKNDFSISAGVRFETSGITDDLISPRAGLRKKIIKNMFFNSAVGLYYKYPTNLQMYDKKYGNPHLKAEKAAHYLAGFENHFSESILFKNDVFYKDYQDLVISDPEKEYINGAVGYAYGLESILQKKESGRFEGWLAYTYALTRRKVKERSEVYDPYNQSNLKIGEWYYPEHDQRHTVSAVGNYKISSGWSLYANWEFHTGTPYTEIEDAKKVLNSEGNIVYLPVKSQYNAARLPAYHKLDFKIIYNYMLFGSLRTETYLQFINLYNQKNVAGYYYVDDYQTKKASYYFPFFAVLGTKINF